MCSSVLLCETEYKYMHGTAFIELFTNFVNTSGIYTYFGALYFNLLLKFESENRNCMWYLLNQK